jgi:hypothetical protein
MNLRTKTMTVVATGALSAMALLTTMPKASAEDWCRFNEHNIKSCGFATREQCQATASGRPGSCQINPFPGKATAAAPIHVESQAELMACQEMHLDCVGGNTSSAYAYAPSGHLKHKAQ